MSQPTEAELEGLGKLLFNWRHLIDLPALNVPELYKKHDSITIFHLISCIHFI